MLRLFVLAFLLGLAILEYKKALKPFIFPVVFGLLTLMLALRCGQGTDYFSYAQIYTDPAASGVEYEVGYMLLNRICWALNLPFVAFVFMYSLIVMGVLYGILYKACTNRFMGLFVIYALYYLQFFENSLRQVLAMMLVLAGYWLAASKKRVWFALAGTALAFTLHTSALVSLVFVLPYWLVTRRKLTVKSPENAKKLCIAAGLVCAALIVFSFTPLLAELSKLLPASLESRLTYYIKNTSYSPMSLLSRLVFLGVTVVLYAGARRRSTDAERILFYVYLTGFIVYCALFRFETIASRMNAYFKMTEIILIPNFLGQFTVEDLRLIRFRSVKKWVKTGLLSGCAVLLVFMYLKTTKDVMGQSCYNRPGYIYPYYSVFTVKEMYNERHAPNYSHKEFYTVMEKPNPRLIGGGDTLSQTYILPVSSPWDWAIAAYEKTVTDYAINDPLTPKGSLVYLLNEFYGGDVYRKGQEVISPTPTPKEKLPILWDCGKD